MLPLSFDPQFSHPKSGNNSDSTERLGGLNENMQVKNFAMEYLQDRTETSREKQKANNHNNPHPQTGVLVLSGWQGLSQKLYW